MQLYKLLRFVGHIKSSRMRLFGLWGMHVLRRRYLGVYIDTVLGCNYRCRMCYYSNEQIRQTRRGRMSEEQVERVAAALFPYALKAQIGCGAEPTMDPKGMVKAIKLAHQYGVPYISITTNGALLTESLIRTMVDSGLNEITISLHGIHRDTYEKMMGNSSSYDKFLALLDTLRLVKKDYPALNIRVNYTMNADNVDELADFDTLFHDIPITQLQLRPIRKIGESDYNNFDLTHVAECLSTIVEPLVERCKQLGIDILYPKQIHLDHFEHKIVDSARSMLVSYFTYYNINPLSYSNSAMDYDKENYRQYCRRKRMGWKIFSSAIFSESYCEKVGSGLTDALNYDIN